MNKKTIDKLMETKSLSTIIREGHFNATLNCPMLPARPKLSRVHSSEQALTYSLVLGNYETDMEHYRAQLKIYRENQRALLELFKWACLRDIGGLCTDLRPKYLQAVEIAWNMAWERGHSEGLYGVYQELTELNEILACI